MNFEFVESASNTLYGVPKGGEGSARDEGYSGYWRALVLVDTSIFRTTWVLGRTCLLASNPLL